MAVSIPSQTKYIEGIGRRKTATARVRIYPSDQSDFLINDERTLAEYFPLEEHQLMIRDVLKRAPVQDFVVSIHVSGGGPTAQAGAVRLGLARAIIAFDATQRPALKAAGMLTRDARIVERKKFGLKKARKAAQWSKR